MKTIKKTTLIAAITAMAAFVVPAMASAAVWGPLNTNQSLDVTNVNYSEYPLGPAGWRCSSQHLGVHVRTPASSTLDITSASWTGCTGTGGWGGCNLTVTPTGLPWTATAVPGGAVFPLHAQMTWGCNSWGPINLDATTLSATWNASTHTVTINSTGLTETIGATVVSRASVTGDFRNPTQTLTLT